MAELRTCPSRDELQRMVLGKLTVTRAEAIAQHLDECPICLDFVRQWVASDEILEAVRATRNANGQPTKTMYLPIGKIREAVSTWIGAHDETCSDPHSLPPSLADFKSLLSPPQSADEIGRVADFRVLRLLGVGGMAAVFDAEDTRLKRRVALKLLHPAIAAKPGGIERFLREAQSAAALKHEHVVTIYQVGLHQETPFLVLELLHGETLENHLARNGRLSVREIIRIGREIAQGLAAAHARGLLHRDIKPANVWLEGPPTPSPVKSNHLSQGKSPSGKVKILDFGLAKACSDESEISHAGVVIGTPQYMAPEQVAGNAADSRIDLFSLGCVLYRMATGRAPFGGSDLLSVLRSLACEEPPPVQSLNPQVPSALSDLIGQLISKSPDQRPPSALVVVDRLQAIAEDLAAGRDVNEPATGPVKRDPAGHRRGRIKWLVGAVIGLVVLLPLSYLFGAQLIRIATNKGQVVIEIDDPQVEVTIRENRVAIQDRPGQREITLTAGEHQLDVTVKEPTGEKTFKTERFTLSRGGRKVIEVREELSKALTARPTAPAKPLISGTVSPAEKVGAVRIVDGKDRDRRAAQWVLSLGGSVTVQVRDQANPIEVQAGRSLPLADFELTKIHLNARPATDAGLDELTGLKNLGELVLSGTQITDAGLAHLAGLTLLESLALDQTRVTDAGLAHLKGLTELTSLRLSATSVTDAGLAQLQGLTALKQLWLDNTRVTDGGLTNLRGLKNLQFLSLSCLPVTDTGLAQLQGLKRLQFLDLEGTRVTDAGLAKLRSLKDLQGLMVDRTLVTDAGLAQLAALTKLAVLDLRETQVTGAGLVQLNGLKNLHELRLNGARQVGDIAIPGLLHIPRLQRIDLSDTRVSAKGFAILKASLPSGAVIAWSEPNDIAARGVLAAGGRVDIRVQGAAEDHLAKAVSELPSEYFQITRVSLAGVRQPLKEVFEALKKPGVDALGSLDLSDTAIGDADLRSLKGLTHLRRLVLDGTNIDGEGLIHLQGMPELIELRLGCRRLSELLLVELAGFTKLEKLSLSKSHVSDEGIRQLVQLTHLKELDLTETQVTAAGARELQKSLPGCRILTTVAHH